MPDARGLPGRGAMAGAAARVYRPIEDCALIGDCHGSALVARDGGIDRAALHRFDSNPVFCRLLGADRGGFWSIRPFGSHASAREYLPGTNILRTVFETPTGSAAVTDFMPVGRKFGASAHDYVHLNAPGWIIRRIEGLRGTIDFELGYRPSRAMAGCARPTMGVPIRPCCWPRCSVFLCPKGCSAAPLMKHGQPWAAAPS